MKRSLLLGRPSLLRRHRRHGVSAQHSSFFLSTETTAASRSKLFSGNHVSAQYQHRIRNTLSNHPIADCFPGRHPNYHLLRSLSSWSSLLYSPTTRSFRLFSSASNAAQDFADTSSGPTDSSWFQSSFCRFQDGPGTQLGWGSMARQARSSVIGTSGSTVLLTTVACQPQEESGYNNAATFLTVDYRQRHAAVGHIPTAGHRRDNTMPLPSEILAGRALDRALRPLLLDTSASATPLRWHVHASVQACELWGSDDDDDEEQNYDEPSGRQVDKKSKATSGHPVALAINTASAALYSQLKEPVAATVLSLLPNGTLVQDPTPAQVHDSIGHLLYAGTRNETVMMEWTSHYTSNDSDSDSSNPAAANATYGLSERQDWPALLQVAHASIQPVLDTIEELHQQQQQQDASSQPVASDEDADEETQRMRAELGLSAVEPEKEDSLPEESSASDSDSSDSNAVKVKRESDHSQQDQNLEQAIDYCQERLGNAVKLLFGAAPDANSSENGSNGGDQGLDTAHLHPWSSSSENKTNDNHNHGLLSKAFRGRREQLIQQEVARLVDLWYKEAEVTDMPWSEQDRSWFCNKVHSALMRRAFVEASIAHGTRADGRRGGEEEDDNSLRLGWKTIRPLRVQVPALPSSVHGSSLFARGDTQVLCTITLGAPREGMPRKDPYQPVTNPRAAGMADPNKDVASASSYQQQAYPVGSLRFLRTQEALVSDMNSRKVVADKERTGESGKLADVHRAFLQYDFPAYSTGEVPQGSAFHNRRAIGHGALAERAVLPVLPDTHDFPYVIRMTSEVTDSNGSSSMASVCGATLALLDAGVPILEPVAGVSVGLALNENGEHRLLLDITGTEDHYGAMDFKIAGTRHGVTALQLDVKQPLPPNILLEALNLARAGRRVILDEMEQQTKKSLGGLLPRSDPKESAPRVEVVRFDPARKRDLVGPGGVVLRQLEDRYSVSLDLTQEGQCLLFGASREMVANAKSTIMDLVADVEEGGVYEGTIIETRDFGAIVELLRNKEGILHISELMKDNKPASSLRDHQGRINIRVGQKIKVVCTGIDPVQGTIRLSLG